METKLLKVPMFTSISGHLKEGSLYLQNRATKPSSNHLPPKGLLSFQGSLYYFCQFNTFLRPFHTTLSMNTRLHPYLSAWEVISTDTWVLTIIWIGYAIELESYPYTHFAATPPSHFFLDEIHSLLNKEAIEGVPFDDICATAMWSSLCLGCQSSSEHLIQTDSAGPSSTDIPSCQ